MINKIFITFKRNHLCLCVRSICIQVLSICWELVFNDIFPKPNILQRIDDFRKSFNKAMIDLDAFTESLQDLRSMRPTEISEVVKRKSGTNVEMQNVVKMIIKNGKSL